MLERYSRQVLFAALGKEGQARLAESSVVIVGCGGLGGTIAMALVRAGVGKVRLIDRDKVELQNLHRQMLFDEDDVRNGVPKAIAAVRRLKAINSSIDIEGIVTDATHSNIEKLIAGVDLILDGLDNFETRLILNDASLKTGIPWIYGGVVAASGMVMNIVPGKTPCLRCILPYLPHPDAVRSPNTHGIIGPTPFVIGSLQATEAIKLLIGDRNYNRDVIVVDIWNGTMRPLKIHPRVDCPACMGDYQFLRGRSLQDLRE